jgi:exosortase
VRRILPAAGVLLAVFVWSYWPTILDLIQTWNNEADYSHGYLVVPFSLVFLWARRDLYPRASENIAWLGLIPILSSIVIRYIGAQWYLGSVDGWSMMFWIAGVVWMLGGWRILWWSLPSIAFLAFMVPLPWRFSGLLSVPLQRIATKVSCWVLQFLGEPALSSGNTIFLGEQKLEVAAACAGLRIFMGVLALAFAYVVLCRRTWWERAFLLLIAPPIAVIANITRIVVTGLLYQHADSERAQVFFHDTAGWAMIVLAAALYGLVLWYLSWVVREAEEVDTATVVGRQRETRS